MATSKSAAELTQALSKVVHAENMEKIRLEEDLEGKSRVLGAN